MYRAERAIIMAAGIGKRLMPVTANTPKPLVTVNGVRMIETAINALHSNGIKEIHVVVGYLKEKFRCLENEYNVHLIENPHFNSSNNISSLYAARKFIPNSIILDGDQIIRNSSVLTPVYERSGYNAVWTDEYTDEWLMFAENGIVRSCSRTGGKAGWQLYSVSRWNEKDGRLLALLCEKEFIQKNNRDIYWDDIAMFCYPDNFQLGIKEISKDDIIEIDNLCELAQIDRQYEKYLGGSNNEE